MQPRDLAIALQQAVQQLDESQVKELLSQGASPSFLINKTTALHEAVQNRVTSADKEAALTIVELLLDNQHCNMNQLAVERTVMSLAAYNCFWDAVLLIAQKKITDSHDKGHYGSALIDVVRFCDDEDLRENLVVALLEARALLNRYSENTGYNALHWCVEKDIPSILKLLLEKHPQVVTREGKCKKTPARLAYEQEKWDCLSVIGGYAYWPHINGDKDRSSEIPFTKLVAEKEIIFKYVCGLEPLEEQLRMIRDGQNELCLLGLINNQSRGLITFGDTKTIELYKEREIELVKLIEPQSLLRASFQLFSSAPRLILSKPQAADNASIAGTPEGIDMGYMDRGEITSSAPIPIRPKSKEEGSEDQPPRAHSHFAKWFVAPLSGAGGSSPEDDKNALVRRLSSSPNKD